MTSFTAKYILVGLDLVSGNPNRIVAADPAANLAVVRIDHEGEERELSQLAHIHRRCGGFELLPDMKLGSSNKMLKNEAQDLLKKLTTRMKRDQNAKIAPMIIQEQPNVNAALALVSSLNIKESMHWFSGFKTRYHKHADANLPVMALREKIAALVASRADAELTLVDHSNTAQKSLRLRLPGTHRKSEVLVFGGHLDSINSSFFSSKRLAPGADDNASGVAALLEFLRIVVAQPPLDRTLEFMFYAGEEGGLLGSAEIAKDYKKRNVDVVSVVQLDMTSFPGSGPFVLGSMTDFTSPALREYLFEINRVYVGGTVVNDQCGYACSDHASWYRQGFPTLMPFESRTGDMNKNIHSEGDTVNAGLNFDHAAMFSKIALAMALDLGKSSLRF